MSDILIFCNVIFLILSSVLSCFSISSLRFFLSLYFSSYFKEYVQRICVLVNGVRIPNSDTTFRENDSEREERLERVNGKFDEKSLPIHNLFPACQVMMYY